MKRHKFDSRTLQEVVEEIKSLKTSPGDQVKLLIYYSKSAPRVWIKPNSYDPDKKQYASVEEISDWMDDSPSYHVIDDSTGRPMSGEFRRGYNTWEEYMTSLVIPSVTGIMNTGGRALEVEILEKPLDA